MAETIQSYVFGAFTIWRRFCSLPAGLVSSLLLLSLPPVTRIASAAPPAAVSAPPLAFHVTTLKNGLKIITLEDHHAPIVTLEVWYRVGSKDETPGRFGFAHLFEHLMFKGSKNVLGEGHARYMDQIGGHYNADTGFDRTRFYETVGANAMDRALFLEADRMASLIVDQKNLDSERHVVEEELRLKVTNAAYGEVNETIQSMVYATGHPYAHLPIGNIDNLDAATLPEVRAFHDTYYKPDNATLVLTGDFQTADALSLIGKYFGPIPPRGKPFPRQPIPLTPPPSALEMRLAAPLAALPAVMVAFPTPPARSPDAPVLRVIAEVIGGGQTSSSIRDESGEKAKSSGVSARLSELRFGGFFAVRSGVGPGEDPRDVVTALKAEVDHLRYRPVAAEDLADAKSKALTSIIFESLDVEQTADRLANSDLLYGTPDEVNQTYRKIAAVTAADIQRVVNRYLLPENSDVLYIQPTDTKKGDAP